MSNITTGKFDSSNIEIFVGDRVMKWWSGFRYQGKQYNGYQIHTINQKPAHMMANGQMHDDGGGLIFCMGSSYNFWEGSEVTKVSEQDFNDTGIPEDTTFFFLDGKPTLMTDKHWVDATDEEWETHPLNFQYFLKQKLKTA